MKRISFNAGELSPELLQRKNGQWVWEPFTFKTIPWRHSGYRDASVLILSQANGTYSVVIPDSLLDVERSMESGDVLRASYYTEQQEAFSYRSSLLSGVIKTELLSHASAYARSWGQTGPARRHQPRLLRLHQGSGRRQLR